MTRVSELVTSVFKHASGDEPVEPSPPPGWFADWIFDAMVCLVAIPIVVVLVCSLLQTWRLRWRHEGRTAGEMLILCGPWTVLIVVLLALVVWRLAAGATPPDPLDALAPILFGALVVISGGLGLAGWLAFVRDTY
jgi:hypothetical protein